MNFKQIFRVQAAGAVVRGSGMIIRARTGDEVPFIMLGYTPVSVIEKIGREIFGLGWLYSRQLGAVTHGSAIRDTICNAVVDALDASGNLIFRTSGDAEVATCPFSATAFGAASGGTATANAITSDTSATGGTVAKWTAETSGATIIFTGAAGTSGSDINLSSLTVGASDTVSVSSLTYSAPA